VDKIFWLEDGVLAGRCGPSKAVLDVESLRLAGFACILSLDSNEYDLIKHHESQIPMNLIHLPNSIPPQPSEIKIFELLLPKAVEFVAEKIDAGQVPLLVHCHAGNDRTGGVLTGYISQKHDILPRLALERVREANPEAISAFGYEEMILSILEKMRGIR